VEIPLVKKEFLLQPCVHIENIRVTIAKKYIYTIMSVYTAHGLRHLHKNIFLYERNDSLLETPSNASMQEE
jgi:uncharacterized protein YqhQ